MPISEPIETWMNRSLCRYKKVSTIFQNIQTKKNDEKKKKMCQISHLSDIIPIIEMFSLVELRVPNTMFSLSSRVVDLSD